MNDVQKQWIDDASYETLLRHWRLAPPGDIMFRGECGEYYAKVMAEKKDGLAAETSKKIGWEK